MPELILTQDDRDRLADLLQDRRCPHGIRPGAWLRLVRHRTLDVLEMRELRALAFAEPAVLEVLDLPRYES